MENSNGLWQVAMVWTLIVLPVIGLGIAAIKWGADSTGDRLHITLEI
jgi:hypothetical protein